MGSGRGSWVNALRPLRRARVYPDLLGLLQRVRAFFLRVSFVRGGISVAAGRTSGRDFGTRAQHCVGARHLLCSSHSFELEIRLHYPHRFLNPDYSVFDCGRVAVGEGKLMGTAHFVQRFTTGKGTKSAAAATSPSLCSIKGPCLGKEATLNLP